MIVSNEDKDGLLIKLASKPFDVIIEDEKERDIALMLYSDGYIYHVRSDGKSKCKIKPTGKAFIEKGGYSAYEKQEHKKARKGLWISWWMELLKDAIILVLGVLLGYLLSK